MTKIPARIDDQRTGWVRVPANRSFDWALRLEITPRTTVTVPVRVHTRDRGWTQYFFADLAGLNASQLEQLVANNTLELDRDAA